MSRLASRIPEAYHSHYPLHGLRRKRVDIGAQKPAIIRDLQTRKIAPKKQRD